MPPSTSTQRTELIALIQGLILEWGIYTDWKYAFLVLYAHAAIWKERRLLKAKNSPVTYGAKILHLKEAAQKLKLAVVIYCHQKENSQLTRETIGQIRRQRKKLWCPHQVETNIKKIQQQAPWLQQTINHQSLLFIMEGEIENWFSSLFSRIPQGMKNFPTGDVQFLMTSFLSIIMIYAILCLVFYCLPYCCKLVALFSPRRRPGTNRSRPSILKIEKHVKF